MVECLNPIQKKNVRQNCRFHQRTEPASLVFHPSLCSLWRKRNTAAAKQTHRDRRSGSPQHTERRSDWELWWSGSSKPSHRVPDRGTRQAPPDAPSATHRHTATRGQTTSYMEDPTNRQTIPTKDGVTNTFLPLHPTQTPKRVL